MYTTAASLVLLLCTKDLFVAAQPDAKINKHVAEDGRSYYSTPLSCSYSSLLMANYYNRLRSAYTMTNNRDCCYLSDTRNKCCVQTDSQGSYQGCKCDPSINCDSPTTTTTTTTTTVPTTTTTTTQPTTTTTTLPTTTTRTTQPTTTTTTTLPTTTSTTLLPTTTTRTTVPTTTRTTKATTTKKTTRKATTTKKTTTKATTTTTTRPTTTTTTTTRPTTTTVTTTTTTSSKALCGSSFRLLNGESASSDCPNSGVFKITFPGETTSTCNAVYTLATVNGVYKPTILTDELCKIFIESATSADDAFELHIGSQKYKLLPPDFTAISGPSKTAFIDVAQSQSHILDEVAACQAATTCPYKQNTMQGKVDMTRCKILSWGVSDSDEYTQNGLNEAALTINTGGCQAVADPEVPNAYCFKTSSGKNLICANDSGSPVYCKATETDEWILMGVTGQQNKCDFTQDVVVLPYPG